jgi:hypothetical protein
VEVVSARVRLGSWRLPSGNAVDVFLEPPATDGVRDVTFEWNSAPPLCQDDELCYFTIIQPAVVRRVREYLELPVRAAVVAFR